MDHLDKPDSLCPTTFQGMDNLKDIYDSIVKKNPDGDHLGTRDNTQEGRPYVWKSWK
jgi:hypothetical protein